MASPIDKLSNNQAAHVVGVKPGTWRKMVQDGYAPKAEEPTGGREEVSGRPWFYRWAVEHCRDNRPGRGFRTDLVRKREAASARTK